MCLTTCAKLSKQLSPRVSDDDKPPMGRSEEERTTPC